MDVNKKKQYVTAVSGTVSGMVLLLMTWNMGINEFSGRLIGLIGVLFFGAGAASFYSPMVSEILSQIMQNLFSDSQEKNISQLQHNPINSPQTAIVQRDQYIINGKSEETVRMATYNKDKIKNRLYEIKSSLESLNGKNFREGNSKLSTCKTEIIGIIHRIYHGDPAGNEKRLIRKQFLVYSRSNQDSEFQRSYLEKIEDLIATIEVILREMDLE